MRGFRRHPSFKTLSQYVDLGEDQPDWRQIRSHLRECTKCRDEVAWLRRLSEEARKLGPVQPPEDTLERVLERRAAGERVILPAAGPVATDDWTPPGSTWVLALVAGALVSLSAFLLLVPEATAGSNNLAFEPAEPRAGETLEVRYRPTIALAGADSLRLRAHFRGVGQERGDPELPGGRLETILRPDEDGLYVGTIRIPAVAAYGQMAVEDTEATYVDSNNGRLWEVLTHDEDGVRYEALRQRVIANTRQDWRRALETVEQMTALFPDRPEAWYRRLAMERQFIDTRVSDSLLAYHRGVLARLQVELPIDELSASDMSHLASYATALGDEAAAEFWEGSLERTALGHPRLLRLRAFETFAAEEPSSVVLARIDSLWARSNHGDADVAQVALDRALGLNDHTAAKTWALRLRALRPGSERYIGRRLAMSPSTRREGIRYLREAADRVREAAEARPLRQTRERWTHERRAELRAVLAALGHALLADGSRAEAREVLKTALRLDGFAVAASELAELALAVGDSANALRLLAGVAADPLAADSVDRRGRDLAAATGLPPGRWAEMRSARRDSLEDALLRDAAYRVLPPEVSVQMARGRTVPLRDLAADRPTLLAVAIVYSPASVRQSIDQIAGIHGTADRLGHRLVALLLPWRGYDPGPFSSGDVPFPVAYDRNSDATAALGLWTTASFVVLDAEGVFRGVFPHARDALRLLSVLPRAPLTA